MHWSASWIICNIDRNIVPTPCAYIMCRKIILAQVEIIIFYLSVEKHHIVMRHVVKIWTTIQGLYSQGGKTSYRQISWSLEATGLDVIMIASL